MMENTVLKERFDKLVVLYYLSRISSSGLKFISVLNLMTGNFIPGIVSLVSSFGLDYGETKLKPAINYLKAYM